MPYAAIAQLNDGTTQHITYEQAGGYSLNMDLVSNLATSVTFGSKLMNVYSANGESKPYLLSVNLGTGCPLTLYTRALNCPNATINTGDRVNCISGDSSINANSVIFGNGIGVVGGASMVSVSGNRYILDGNGYADYTHGTLLTVPQGSPTKQCTLEIRNGVQKINTGNLFPARTEITNTVSIPSSVKWFRADHSLSYPNFTGGSGIQYLGQESFLMGGTGGRTLGNPAIIGLAAYGGSVSSANLSKALIAEEMAFEGHGTLQSLTLGNKMIYIGKNCFDTQYNLTGRLTCKAYCIDKNAFEWCSGLTSVVFDISDRPKRKFSYIGDSVLHMYYVYPKLPRLRSVTIKGYNTIYNIFGGGGTNSEFEPGFTIDIEGNGDTTIGWNDEMGSGIGRFTTPEGFSRLTIGSGVTSVYINVYGMPGSGNTATITFGTDVEIINMISTAQIISDRGNFTYIVEATTPPQLNGLKGPINTILVPAASLNDYKTAEKWSNYAGIINPN